jgi:hypothetical protein
VRSRNSGKNRTQTPELIYANPFGCSQDPCMVQLRDGTIVCTSYGWALLQAEAAAKLKNAFRHGAFVFLGGYLLRSKDGSHSWQGPIIHHSRNNSTIRAWDARIHDSPVGVAERGGRYDWSKPNRGSEQHGEYAVPFPEIPFHTSAWLHK